MSEDMKRHIIIISTSGVGGWGWGWGVVSMFNEPLILSLSGVVRDRLLPRSAVVTAKRVVSCTRITCIQPLSRCSLIFPAVSFFSESVCLLLLFVFSLFSSTIRLFLFFFVCGLLANSYPLLACLIRAAILHFSFRRHLFLDRGRVSEGLVRVSLAFHLFVVGTVIFASVLLCQVKSKTSLFLQRKTWMPHIKPQRQCKKCAKD